jgi:hypothetical protein
MYPSDRLARSTTSDYETKWWLDDQFFEKPGVTPADDHLAKRPVKTHIFSREEMGAFAEEKIRGVKDIDEKKDFLDIIKSAVALKSSLLLADNHAETQGGTLPLGLFKPAIPYSDQELVNLSCLVDRRREFEVNTEYESRNKFAIRVDSYQLNPMRNLKSYLEKGSKEPPARPLMIAVYKNWLKQYLDWFDPDLFEFISAHAASMKVLTFAYRLASNYDHDYKMQAQIQYDPLLVPVPKMHEKVSTCDDFGVTEKDVFQPYCKDTYARLPSHSRAVRQASYDEKLTATCNTSGFEYVPIARMPSSTAPDHPVQIKALRADIAFTGKKETTRWLGLQGGKYVSLPTEWVILNFDTSILEEAKRRAMMVTKGGKKSSHDKFVTLPVGDSREDDPPRGICNNKGLNYYYQGKTDVCVLGGLANAVCWMIGLDPVKDLLHNHSPTMDSFWFHFVQHVKGVMRNYGYLLRNLKCQDILKMDDLLPVVVQLRGGYKSESHSVCIYDGSVFDSASRFVLVKSRETLNWCCGDYGFEAHVHLYRLQLNLKVKGVEEKKVKAKRPRFG